MSQRASWLTRLVSPAIHRARVLGRDDSGVRMFEFGCLALPFFTIIAATSKPSLVFLARQILDSAVQDPSRLPHRPGVERHASVQCRGLARGEGRQADSEYPLAADAKINLLARGSTGWLVASEITYPHQPIFGLIIPSTINLKHTQ